MKRAVLRMLRAAHASRLPDAKLYSDDDLA
jgi:hypothetical protein